MDIRRTRLFAYLVVLILLLGQLPVMPVRAIGTDDPILENDEGRIIKTAEPVEGEVNKWKITVRAEYKSKPKPTDLLISLDRSGSMKYGERLADGSVEMQNVPVERQRMTVAKQAISKLADVALAENPDNLMALQSWSYGYNYGTQVFSNSLTEHNDFTHDANAIKGSLDQVPVGGGTFTQKALRMGDIAMGRAKQADTDNKKQRAIVLITDGRPTVGYKVDRNKISNDAWANMWSWQTNISSTGDTTTGNWIQNASDGVTSTTNATYPKYVGGRYYLVGPAASPMEGSGAGAYAPLNAFVSNGNVPAGAFNYADSGNSDIINRIGWGVDLPYAVEGIDGNGNYYYWDIRENTVIEANKVKQSGNFDRLYIIGLTTTDQLDTYLNRMATPGDFRATTINNLDDTIQAIYKDLQTEVPTDCSLTDEIGAHFNAPEDIHVTCGNYEVVNADPENGVAGQIKWTIGTPQNAVDKNAFPKVYREELTYTLTIKDGWETLNQDTFSTNGQTSITINKKNNNDEPYDPKNYEAPSPQVQPVKVGIIKKLVNQNGEEIETSDEFNIRLKKDTTQVSGKIKTSETSYFDLTEAGTYTVEEFSEDADGTLPYEVSYKINGQETDTFTIDSTGTVVFSGGQQITSTKNDIMIEVINQERPTPTYKVTYEYESGEAGVELPEEVKALTPADEPGKADGTKVTPTAPAKTTVETEEGTWTFAGYDENEKTIAGADAKFIGTWNFTPKTPATPQSILVKKIDFLTGQGVEGAEFGLMKTSGGGQGGSAGAPVRPRLKSLLETMEAARPDSVAERITAKQAELKTLKEQLAQLQQTIAQEEGKVPEESEPVLTAGEVNVTSGSVLTEEQIVSAITLNGEALPESVQVLIDDSGLSTTEAGIYTVHVTLTFEDSSIRIIDVTVVVTEGADALNSEGADAFNSTDGIDSIEGNDIPDEDSGLEPDPESTPNPDPLADPQTESGQDEVTSIDPQEPQAFNGVRLCFTAAEMSDLKAKMAALEAEIAALEEQIAEDTAQLSDRKEALAQAQIQQTNQSDSLKTSLTLLGYTNEQISACCDPQTGLMQSYLLSPDQVNELMPTDIGTLAELETQIATLQAETLERDAYEALRQSLETAMEAQPVERMIMYAPTPGNGLTPIATGKTNARGELLFDNLEPGSYQIQELNAAAGYVPLTGVDAIWPKDTQGNPASVVVDQNGEQVVIQVVNKPYVNVHEDPLSPMPDGYVRIVFDATEDGTTDGKHRYTVIDVLEGLEWNDPKVTDHFPGNARPNSGDKAFDKWGADIPTSGPVMNSVFVASYKGSPVTPPVPVKPTNEPDTGKLTVMMPLRTQPTVTELVPVKPVRTVVNLPRTGSAQTSAHVFGLIAAMLGAALLAYSKRLR